MGGEIRNLDRLARMLVRGFPILATVRYERRSQRLTLSCRSRQGPTGRPNRLRMEWSPVADEAADLDRYVRDRVGDFLRLWIRDESPDAGAVATVGPAPAAVTLPPVPPQNPGKDLQPSAA